MGWMTISQVAVSPCVAPPCVPQASCSTKGPSSPGSSPSARSRKPGAIIESFVNHAPGVFSGTFSGEGTFWEVF